MKGYTLLRTLKMLQEKYGFLRKIFHKIHVEFENLKKLKVTK